MGASAAFWYQPIFSNFGITRIFRISHRCRFFRGRPVTRADACRRSRTRPSSRSTPAGTPPARGRPRAESRAGVSASPAGLPAPTAGPPPGAAPASRCATRRRKTTIDPTDRGFGRVQGRCCGGGRRRLRASRLSGAAPRQRSRPCGFSRKESLLV